MSIRKYEVFLRVAELGSLTKAAESLGYTQSGVSHVISGLEEELGFPLLRRSRSGVSLTDAGARIMPAIHGMLNYHEQLSQLASSIRGMDLGTVRVGVFTSVAVRWLPAILKDFLADYPNIEFKLLNGDYSDVERSLTEGMIDLEYISLLQERVLAILPPDHRLANMDRLPPEELCDEPFIGLLQGSDQDARRALETAGVEPNPRFTTKDDYAIIAMVEQGLGVAVMPELLLEGRKDNILIKEFDPPAFRTIALAFSDTSHSSPAAQRFAEYVCRWVKNHYGSLPDDPKI